LKRLVESKKNTAGNDYEIIRQRKAVPDTFNQINENLNLFIKLFGEESYAELRLVEDEPLELTSKSRKAPGKKPLASKAFRRRKKTLVALRCYLQFSL
jgi:chromosome segregation ATPase